MLFCYQTPEERLIQLCQSGTIQQRIEHLSAFPNLDVNTTSPEGYAPLHFAAGSNTVSLVKALIARNADVNIKACGIWTPLHCACDRDSYGSAVVLLSRSDINVNVQTHHWGITPLMKALSRKSSGIYHLLLSHRQMDVDVKDKQDRTALHYAFSDQVDDAIKTILTKTKLLYYNFALPTEQISRIQCIYVLMCAKTNKRLGCKSALCSLPFDLFLMLCKEFL